MSLICFRRLAMGWFVLCLTVSLSSSSSKADELSDLKSKVTQLELQVDEQKTLIETLKRERDESRREVQRLKGNPPPAPPAATGTDPFRVGVVWVGEAKSGANLGKFALSISERDGENYKGAIVTVTADGQKNEMPVAGKAPTGAEGEFTLQTSMVGRAQFFARGRLNNGEVALAFSGTNALGEKKVGPATLRPKN